MRSAAIAVAAANPPAARSERLASAAIIPTPTATMAARENVRISAMPAAVMIGASHETDLGAPSEPPARWL